MATNQYSSARLEHLKDSDFEVADGQPDIRGWDVKDAEGRDIGDVKDLIFDVETLKVRYMVVDLDDNDFDLDDRKVLIPIGLGELHEKGDDVILPSVTAEQLAALPEYKDIVTTEDEYAVRNVFAGSAGMGAATLTNATPDPDFYSHDHYNMDNMYKRRRNTVVADEYQDTAATDSNAIPTTPATARPELDTDSDTLRTTGTSTPQEDTTIPVIEENVEIGKQAVQTGGAYIRSRIVEKPVEEQVNLREEHVQINRNPVDRPANSTDFDTFKEGVIEITEHAEVPVVNKEARVVEEITVSKDVAERTETVRDTVRKTEVEIEDLGGTTDAARTNRRDDLRDI